MNPFSEEKPVKLIVSRRAIAAGLAALVGAPAAAAAQLKQLTNVPLGFDPADFAGQMSDGLFLPDYRHPMVRVVFADGSTTLWHRYSGLRRGNAVAIETCAPDKNGSPRYAQLAIG
jgi:hypothetical protein